MRVFTRLAIPVAALALLAGGCKREPDFDERYDSASRSIVEKAKAIDAQISATSVPSDAAQDDPVQP